MQCGIGHCGHCQLGPTLVCRDGPVYRWIRADAAGSRSGSCERRPSAGKPTLAVWKFSSCDGCQLSLLDCEDELLALAEPARRSPTSSRPRAPPSRGPTTCRSSRARSRRAHDAERIREVRRQSRALITIGACATAGGIQALRNFADVDEFTRVVYASPDYISTLATSTPISAHVPVDFELQRLPDQQAPAARGDQRAPQPPPAARARAQRVHRVQAPRDGMRDGGARDGLPRARSRTPAAARSVPPTTAAAMAAYGPMETPNTASLDAWSSGLEDRDLVRVYRTFNARRRRVPRGQRAT